MPQGITRRQLLATTGLAGLGGVASVFSARPAHAFSLATMDATTQRLYLESCSMKDGAYHRELVADVKQGLQGKATEAEIEAALAQMTCPICGCPINTL
jgi:hypothetical protein